MPRKSLSKIDIQSFRNAFCEAAYELYVEKDYDAVTMRGVAKALNCSPMMAYSYFENKEDVFAALRAIRFDKLAQTLEDVPFALTPLEYLRNLAKAYAGFAHQHPHAYRLLYMTPVDRSKIYPDVVKAQKRTRLVLFDATRRAVESGHLKGDPITLAHILWASIHGLVSLNLSNQLHPGASFAELLSTMLDYIFRGD